MDNLIDSNTLKCNKNQNDANDLNDKSNNPKQLSLSKTVSAIFEETSYLFDSKTALIYKDENLSYGDLRRRVTLFSEQLNSIVTQNNTNKDNGALIPLYFEKGIDMVVAILSVLKSGLAYVPISPDYPPLRIKNILDDIGSKYIISSSDLSQSNIKNLEVNQLQVITEAPNKVLSSEKQKNIKSDLAYVIYTSGSTGKPKGVMVEQQSLINLINNQIRAYQFSHNEVSIWLSNYIFDASIETLFLTLLNGACLVIPSSDDIKDPSIIKSMLSQHKVTHLHATPTYLSALGRHEANHYLKRVVSGGDKCPSVLKDIWGDKLINSYGPTETCITASLDLGHDSQKDANCIGKPIENVCFYVLDDELKPVELGETGELYISGLAVAKGYLNQNDLTQASFLPNPFETEGHSRIYKTGDLVQERQDGRYKFIGRNDRQVKIRGYRIELPEIEEALTSITNIDNAMVLVKNLQGQISLIAYLETQQEEQACIDLAKRELQNILPEYMLPTAYVTLKQWPLTLAGKIDVTQLELPRLTIANKIHVPAQTNDEHTLVKIWSDIFELETLGVEDDFFALGGNSITAIRFMSVLRNKMNLSLTMKDFKQNPTIKGVLEASTSENELALGLKNEIEQTVFPLSNQQMVAWYMHQNQPNSKAYLAEAATHFMGEISKRALSKAINRIFERHDIYRSIFVEINGEVTQEVLPHYQASIREINAQHIQDNEKEDFLETTFKTELASMPDLGKLPLAEFILVSFNETHHVLLHQEHHIIHDGWSANEFTGELINQYHAAINPNYIVSDEPLAQYSHFVMSQKAWLATVAAERQKQYWLNQLKDAPQGVNLFGKKSQSLGFAGSHEKMVFNQTQWQAMTALCRELGITAFSFTSSILYLCLWRYSGQTDLTFGSAFANRNWANSHTTLGMFVNTVVLRQKINSNALISDFLKETQSIVDQAQANEELPFPLVVEALNPERSGASNPFFNVLLGFHDTPIHSDSIDGLSWYKDETVISDTSKFDIDCLVVPRGSTFNKSNEVHFLWEYRNDVYSHEEITRFLSSFKQLFLETVENYKTLSSHSLSTLNPISHEESKLLECWGKGNEFTADIKQLQMSQDLVDKIHENAECEPDRIAIEWSTSQITYGELDKASSNLALCLRKEEGSYSSNIAVLCQRNHFAIIAMLAIFKAGSSAVMLGPDLPEKRIEHILKDCDANLVLTDQHFNEQAQYNYISLDKSLIETATKQDTLSTDFYKNESAYVIYTSGSTGVPKGIEVSHSSLYNTVLWHKEEFALSEKSIGTSLAYIGFDAFMVEVWPLLISKGKVVIISDEERDDLSQLMSMISHHKVTHACLPTGLLTLASTQKVNWPSSIKTLLTGGDKLGDIHFPPDFKANFYNLYGPTETSVDATYHKVDLNKLKNIPIGRPIANVTARVITDGQLAPIGVPGELLIGGDGLSLGYVNNEQLNQHSFVRLSTQGSQDELPQKFYRTGDLVKWNEKGELEFLGRLNDEVKVRGYRIALGEINHQLEQDSTVLHSLSVIRDNALYSYVTVTKDEREKWQAGESSERKLIRQLRGSLKKVLPNYMRPNAIMVIDSVPMTPQGKIDKDNLPTPGEVKNTFEAASTSTEQKLLSIWQITLDKTHMSIQDNFFAVGGHSLLAMSIITQVRQAFNVEVKVSDFFEYATIKALSSYIDAIKAINHVTPSDIEMEEGEI